MDKIHKKTSQQTLKGLSTFPPFKLHSGPNIYIRNLQMCRNKLKCLSMTGLLQSSLMFASEARVDSSEAPFRSSNLG
jgi:hypothetical protein